jgi:hypothetical protein
VIVRRPVHKIQPLSRATKICVVGAVKASYCQMLWMRFLGGRILCPVG